MQLVRHTSTSCWAADISAASFKANIGAQASSRRIISTQALTRAWPKQGTSQVLRLSTCTDFPLNVLSFSTKPLQAEVPWWEAHSSYQRWMCTGIASSNWENFLTL
jgi:hypothetical protein